MVKAKSYFQKKLDQLNDRYRDSLFIDIDTESPCCGDNDIHLVSLGAVHPGHKHGSSYMRDLCSVCDRLGYNIILTPRESRLKSPIFWKLVRFYTKFGFYITTPFGTMRRDYHYH